MEVFQNKTKILLKKKHLKKFQHLQISKILNLKIVNLLNQTKILTKRTKNKTKKIIKINPNQLTFKNKFNKKNNSTKT